MRNVKSRGALGLAAVGVVIGATALLASVGAQADSGTNDANRGTATTTITMEQQGKELFFDGPRTVKAGSQLQIINSTDPMEIGPHTFSLVDKDLQPPLDKQAIKDCFKGGVCLKIFKAHKVEFQGPRDITVGRTLAQAGKKGWDTMFGKRGDSWFALNQDDQISQTVSAKPGTTLYYYCDIHPEMRGKIKVK